MGNFKKHIAVAASLAMMATAVALGAGIYSLAKGGEFSKAHSNKLMRLRVMFQAVAVALLMGLVVIMGNGD